MLLFARRSTTPTTATRYCGPRRGQGRSSSRGLHLDRGCGPPVSGSGGGPADNRRSTRAGGDTVDTFIRCVDQLPDRQREVQEWHYLRPRALPESDDGRVALAPVGDELGEAVLGCGLGRRGVNRLERLNDCVAVLAAGVAERGSYEVDDALLNDGVFPGRSNRLGQPLQPVTHGDQHVLDAAVLQLG